MEIKEFLKSKGCWSKLDSIGITTFNNVKPEDIIEFTRHHVQEALKKASENIIIEGHPMEYELDKNSILNSYPLENIK